MKYLIWSNCDFDYDGARIDYQDLHELTDEEMEEISDYDIYLWYDEANNMYLDDERANLNIQLHDEIIVIGDLGLWYGRRSGYKMIKSGNIADCLYPDDVYTEYYCDAHDFRAIGIHHDGTNYYLYRVWKENLTLTQKENFLYKLYHGKATQKDITRYTKSLRPYISAVYGWGGRQESVQVKQYVPFNLNVKTA